MSITFSPPDLFDFLQIFCEITMDNSQSTTPSQTEKAQAEKPKIDVKLLDQQLDDMDSDEFDSDDDHSGGCSCCAGLVGTIRTQ